MCYRILLGFPRTLIWILILIWTWLGFRFDLGWISILFRFGWIWFAFDSIMVGFGWIWFEFGWIWLAFGWICLEFLGNNY